MKKRITTLVFMLLLSMLASEAYSQYRRGRGRTENFTSIGFRAGTLGLGLDLEKSIGAKSSLRLEASMLTYTYQSTEKLHFVTANATGNVDMTSLSLYFNYYPLKSRRNKRRPLRNAFHLTAGVSYKLTNSISAEMIRDKDSKIGQVDLSAERTLSHVDIETNSIAPYLGLGYDIGLRNIMTSRKYRRMFTRNAFMKGLGFGIDLGAFYHGSPTFGKYDLTDLVANGDEQMTKIEENLKGYQFYPNLSFSIRYKFTKGRSVRF